MFQNSGAEATEAAIKVARRYFYSKGKSNKNRVLCIKILFMEEQLLPYMPVDLRK